MTVIQLHVPMSGWNNCPAESRPGAAVRLQMSAQSFAVLSAPRPILIRCLTGWTWITQDANSNDIVLDANQECRLAGAQKIYLNAWDGALLAISDARDHAGTACFSGKWKELRIEITRGSYALSGLGARHALRGNNHV